MKKYIEPNTRCIDIELESLIADSPQGMQDGARLQNKYYGDEQEQLVKSQGSFNWDNEW